VAVNYKILGQSAPSATTATTLYTVPSSTQALISTFVVCNRAATEATFRVACRPNGATLANSHYINYDVALPANDSINLTLGIALGAGDVITVYASSADITFTAFGSEITAA
jgi:glucose-6-phosphate dehydrogenase assembly protein OpcA